MLDSSDYIHFILKSWHNSVRLRSSCDLHWKGLFTSYTALSYCLPGQFTPLIFIPRFEWDVLYNQHDNQILILSLFLFRQFCVTAVLDWELSTIGDPILDLAYSCIPYHWPKELDFVSKFSLGMIVLLSSHYCPHIG